MRKSILFLLLLCHTVLAQEPSSWGQPTGDYLLTGARVMVAPGQTLAKGNIHIVDGRIRAVGVDVTGGPESREISLDGMVVHAGFLDPYVAGSRLGLKQSAGTPVSGEHPRVHDDYRVAEALKLKKDTFKDYRDLGFAVVGVAPTHGIFRGQAAVYSTLEEPQKQGALLSDSAYSAVKFEELGWGKLKGENYPLSFMGSVALFRQTLLDAEWYAQRQAAGEWETRSENLESLQGVRDGSRLMVGESNSFLDVLRLLRVFREAGVSRTAVVLSGQEWMQTEWLKRAAQNSKLIVPLNFPKNPKLAKGLGEEDNQLQILRSWFFAPASPRWIRSEGLAFSFTTHHLKDLDNFRSRVRESVAAGLSERDALAALTTEPATLLGLSHRFGTLQAGRSASLVVREGGPFDAESAIREVWIEGKRHVDFRALAEDEEVEKKEAKVRDFILSSNYASPPRLLAEPYRPGAVLIRNATIWTQGEKGVSSISDLLVRDSKIVAVGSGLSGGGATVIDGTGWHLTPGIVDAHSHTAVDGMVNEPGANVTSMVRMSDVLDPFDHDIYLQLASGVTTTNILHGSANAIGGQAVTCKWRVGASPEEMVFEGAPGGIKFALGENPKQSNWGDIHTSRYPQSRMGVIELIRGSFLSARNYRKLQRAGKNPKPDLKLEALLEVLDGERIVHCHSYRQDEILALIRTAEEVGFKVNVFQHVLEGYKVAEQIADHGATASTFADWWAYKVEVEDAIPHNTYLMHEAGVNVSVNSDSNDLARRLNTEAAKSMRYGEMTEVEALNLITKNGAFQLGILSRVGTLEPGKDADFVIWDDHPLTQEAIVLETWIDGERYFKRSDEAARVAKLESEKQRYLTLLKKKEEK